MPTVLTRNQFRDQVFARDRHCCVLCGAAAVDAHHIIERKLWPDGGYYIENGASVCETCHLRCESTEVSVEEVRTAAGIKIVLVPPRFDDKEPIDKWGNVVLPNGTRMRGPLVDDVSVQRVLKPGVVFSSHVKYPRTPHLTWSPGATADDEVIDDVGAFLHTNIVVTRKMDGENTTLYRDGLHARSLATSGGPERDWVKRFHASIAHEIPEGWRVCGENLFAQHSIAYHDLPSYFLAFSVWDEKNTCLPWVDTVEWCALLGIATVPVLYEGVWDEVAVKAVHKPEHEGYVVRHASAFTYAAFSSSVAKYVRKNHVTTTKHWKTQAIVPNTLREP